MSSDIKNGFFFIADISGYTKFLAETEIKHAKGILESIFNAMLPSLEMPMELSGMRGDAIFAYAIDSEIVSNQFILDMAEKIYCVFSTARDKIEINSSCQCGACTKVNDLDLKVIIHHGEFIVQESKGTKELAGTDVNAVFRLLKNSVEENTGLNAYALITCDAIRQMGIAEFFEDNQFYTETYDHIGEVEYVVHGLKEVYDKRKQEKKFYVGQNDTQLIPETSVITKLSTDVAYTMCSRADLRQIWVAADAVDEFNKKGKVVETGSVYHCHHGDEIFVWEIVDWQPGKYFTGEYCMPMGMRVRETTEFVSTDEGTEIKIRIAPIYSTTFMGNIMKFMATGKVKKLFSGAMERCAVNLVSLSQDLMTKDRALLARPQENVAAGE